MAAKFPYRLKDFDLSRPAPKREYNRRLFGAVAHRYGIVTRLLSFGWDGSWKRLLVRRLPPCDTGQLLDLACGTGDITRLLARRYPRCRVIGIDLTPAMLARARRRSGQASVGSAGGADCSFAQVEFREGDLARLPFGSDSCDIVTGGYALRNAPELRVALAEVYRVLRPGGTAAFLDFGKARRPRIQRVQLRLLGIWGSLWGWLLHRNPEVYGYIARSLALFPDRRAFAGLLRQVGFRSARFRLAGAGFTGLTWCRK
jgi:demethylmenaquinone methyltransferase/2-methoxy-6-polyprenyl-1,4-benzoquinol methylase